MDDERITNRWQAVEQTRAEQLDSAALWFRRLVCLLADLHGADGCPWDREQTLASLRQYIREEADEVVAAIDAILLQENDLRLTAGQPADNADPPQSVDPSRTEKKGLSIAHHPLHRGFDPQESASGAPLPQLTAEQQETRLALYSKLFSEMGDLLLQPVFLGEIMLRMGLGGVEASAEAIVTKLIRRHPHIYGDREAGSAAEVLSNWEEIKRAEREQDQ